MIDRLILGYLPSILEPDLEKERKEKKREKIAYFPLLCEFDIFNSIIVFLISNQTICIKMSCLF